MRDAARLFLERRMSRRGFVSRLAQAGVAAGAAARLSSSLEAQSAAAQGSATAGRVLHDVTGGEVMAEFLVDWKVPYVFGLAGSEEVGFLDALVDRVALQYVQGLHESSVMAMADGYARASGQTAFVQVHSDAGTAYALGQMANAFRDRVPVVITAGGQSTAARGQNVFLEAPNLAQLPRDYTRWTWDVLNVDTIPEVLRRAFLFARVPPGGPTFVTFSKDLWEQRVKRAEILPRSRSEPDSTLHPDPDAVKRTADLLAAARLPLIVAGREMNAYGGADAVRQIAELIGAPVCSDLFASHSPFTFPTFHPQYAGFFAEDDRSPTGYDVFWSVGGTMFTAAGATAQPIVARGVNVIHTTMDTHRTRANVSGRRADDGAHRPVRRSRARRIARRTLPTAVMTIADAPSTAMPSARRQALDEQARRVWDSTPIAIERLSTELNRLIDPAAIVVTELISEEQVADAYFDLNRGPRGRRHFTTAAAVSAGVCRTRSAQRSRDPTARSWRWSATAAFSSVCRRCGPRCATRCRSPS